MSYKLALFDMPAGGAKSVVIGDPRVDKTEALLRALGRAVERLGGRYIIAEDVGTTPDDMRIIGLETKYVVGRATDTGPATAHGVFVGLNTVVKRALKRNDLDGVRVAVQGLGGVGRRLAQRLAQAGAKLVVADVDEKAVARVAQDTGATVVPPDAILEQPVDVLAPCALGAILDDKTIPRLRCRVIAGGANNQLKEERHANLLAERDIVYAPDFVLNAGGVLGAVQEGVKLGSGEDPVYDEAEAFRGNERIGAMMDRVLTLADEKHITPHAAATAIAREMIAARREGRATL